MKYFKTKLTKKIITVFAFAVLFSCAKESPFDKSIADYVQSNFKDPASYEKISVQVLDTITVAKKILALEKMGGNSDHFTDQPKDKFCITQLVISIDQIIPLERRF